MLRQNHNKIAAGGRMNTGRPNLHHGRRWNLADRDEPVPVQPLIYVTGRQFLSAETLHFAHTKPRLKDDFETGGFSRAHWRYKYRGRSGSDHPQGWAEKIHPRA